MYFTKSFEEDFVLKTLKVKKKVDVKKAEKEWKDALKLLNEDCPKKSCEWCEGK